jgi:uncharacterized protein YdaU (DUF1376 family)
MPIYWADYFGDTRHLTRAQHGSYLLLIGHYWMAGALPDDDRQLAIIAGATAEEWQTDKPILQKFFYDGWKHRRIEAELRRTTEKIAKAREHGQKGGQVSAFNRAKEGWQRQRHK